jgi:hypothetical protein
MSKKIILLALAVASMAAFALPATSMAAEEDVPLHAVGVSIGVPQTATGGAATLTAAFGHVTCKSSSGTATFTSTTAGNFSQTFKECTSSLGTTCTTEGQAVGVIVTTSLPFDLVTVEDTITKATGPGVLVTPNAAHFATFACGFIGTVKVGGNGLVGTVTAPACGASSTSATLAFSSSSTGVQTHKTVVGTPTTEYTLTSSLGGNASEDAVGTIAFKNKEGVAQSVKLECT